MHRTCANITSGALLSENCGDLPVAPSPGQCGAPVQYGWEPHPLLMQPPQPIAAPVNPVGAPRPLIAPPQPLLPYGYDAGYNTAFNTNALVATGGDPFKGNQAKLSINPRRLVAPVGQTVVLQGAICGADGYYIRDQPIEWSISPDSVGTIVEVDRTDQGLLDHLMHKPPIKKSGSYAVGRTSMGPQVLPRDPANPRDDVFLNSGQTWVSISSASEGSTHVTAVAPTVTGWNERQQSATIHWVDGRWQFPAPAVSNYGGGHTLTTRVARATDYAPVEGWLVRYEIVGGTPAAFDANGAQTIEVPTNSNGEASVIVVPQGDFSGTTQINMEVIRRGRTPGDLPRLPVGRGSTSITWTGSGTPSVPANPGTNIPPAPAAAPQLTTRVSGVSVAEVGSTATYQLRVENVGNATAENVELSSQVPAQLRYDSSSPQGGEFGDTVRWELGSIEPGMARSVTVTYRVEGDSPIELCATASAAAAQDATDCVRTEVRTNRPNLELQVRGDESSRVGNQVHYDLFVNNLSDRPLSNVEIAVQFDDGLVHAAGPSPIDRVFGGIAPRSVLTQPLNFTVTGDGRRCFRVTVRSAEGASDEVERCIEVAPANQPQSPPQQPPFQQPPPQQTPPQQTPPTGPSPGFNLPPLTGPSTGAPSGGTNQDDLRLIVRRLGPSNDPNALMYAVDVINTGLSNDRNVQLAIQTPEGTQYASGFGIAGVVEESRSPDGRQVQWSPIQEIRAGEKLTFQVTVRRDGSATTIGPFLARATSELHPTTIQASDINGP